MCLPNQPQLTAVLSNTQDIKYPAGVKQFGEYQSAIDYSTLKMVMELVTG